MSFIGTQDFDLEVAKGNVEGTDGRSFYGSNPDLDTADGFQLIWPANAVWTPIAAAETMDIIFANANDTAAGTGAQEVTIIGLDASGNEQTVVEASNGGTVTTTETWTFINQVKVTAAGSSEWNEGNITIQGNTSGNVQSFILANSSVSQQLNFGVPAGHTCYIEKIFFILAKTAGGGEPEVTLSAWKYENGVKSELFEDIINAGVTPIFEYEIPNRVKIPENGYWWILASSDANNTIIRGHVEQKLIQD